MSSYDDVLVSSSPIFKIVYSRYHRAWIKIVIDYNYFRNGKCVNVYGKPCRLKNDPPNGFFNWLWWNLDGRQYVTSFKKIKQTKKNRSNNR